MIVRIDDATNTGRIWKRFTTHVWGLWGEQGGYLSRSKMIWGCRERRQALGCLCWLLRGGGGRVLALVRACLVWISYLYQRMKHLGFLISCPRWEKGDERRVKPKSLIKTPSLKTSLKIVGSNECLTPNKCRNKRNPRSLPTILSSLPPGIYKVLTHRTTSWKCTQNS